MNSVIISPYTGDGSETSFHRPLISDALSGVPWKDVTDRSMAMGIPATNMLVIEAELSDDQVSQLKSDDRFFVLKPGPGNKGSALINWLDSKGATGHGVTEDDDADTAISKLSEYCRAL